MDIVTELGAWNDIDKGEVNHPVKGLKVSDEPPECEVSD